MRTKSLQEALEKVKEYNGTAFTIIDAYITHLERTNFGLRTTVANFKEKQERQYNSYNYGYRKRR